MNKIILACSTLLDCLQAAQQTCCTDIPVVALDNRYHVEPRDMRRHIQETVTALPSSIDTILVAMGFCGGSWQDLSFRQTVIFPRTADCIALSLITPERCDPDLKELYHMYLLGDCRNTYSISAIYDRLLQQYGKRRADVIFAKYFENYHHLDIIDNGIFDCYSPGYVAQAQHDADLIGAELDFVPGSNVMLESLVSGSWDERFVIFPPETVITQGKFYDPDFGARP